MELEATFLVLFPERDVLAIIIEIAEFKLILLSSNLAWFLTNHIVLRRLIRAAVMVTLH
jgi:hypothetical protein